MRTENGLKSQWIPARYQGAKLSGAETGEIVFAMEYPKAIIMPLSELIGLTEKKENTLSVENPFV